MWAVKGLIHPNIPMHTEILKAFLKEMERELNILKYNPLRGFGVELPTFQPAPAPVPLTAT